MDLTQLLAELAKHKPADIVAALPRGTDSLFQTIFQQGYDTSEAKAGEKVRAAESKATEAETARKKAERELEDFRKNPGKTPEVAELVETHKREKAELVAAHQRELETRDNQLLDQWRETQLASLTTILTNPPAELTEELGGKALVPKYASILIQDRTLRDRIRRSKDGTLELLGPDGKTPLVGKDGKAHLGLLAAELVKSADPDFVKVGGNGGSGVDGNRPGGTGDGDYYSRLRQTVAEETGGAAAPKKPEAPAVPATAAGRLGVQPAIM